MNTTTFSVFNGPEDIEITISLFRRLKKLLETVARFDLKIGNERLNFYYSSLYQKISKLISQSIFLNSLQNPWRPFPQNIHELSLDDLPTFISSAVIPFFERLQTLAIQKNISLEDALKKMRAVVQHNIENSDLSNIPDYLKEKLLDTLQQSKATLQFLDDFEVFLQEYSEMCQKAEEKWFGETQKDSIEYSSGMLIWKDKVINLSGFQNKLCDLLFERVELSKKEAEERVYNDAFANEGDRIKDLQKQINKKTIASFGVKIIEYKNKHLRLILP